VSNKKIKSRFDALGDRMKRYEAMETGRILMPGLPVMARLDGISFHTFTKGMPRPYFEPVSMAMLETAKFLLKTFQPNFVYTQSDEITLGFWNDDPSYEAAYNGRVQKLCSAFPGKASSKFMYETMTRMPERAHLIPAFDARVFNMPNLDEMVEGVRFRVEDCAKNSITMAASAFYSHKELMHKNSSQKHEMLFAKGVNWADLPDFFKNGTFMRRETVLRELTPKQLSKIPVDRRPTGPIPRSEVVERSFPKWSHLRNPKEFLFYGAAPIIGPEPLELPAAA
jgi:tRNA(His) guanylyltransferase